MLVNNLDPRLRPYLGILLLIAFVIVGVACGGSSAEYSTGPQEVESGESDTQGTGAQGTRGDDYHFGRICATSEGECFLSGIYPVGQSCSCPFGTVSVFGSVKPSP
jgi:hypothetical protein